MKDISKICLNVEKTGLDALKTQIALDAASARAILANCRVPQ